MACYEGDLYLVLHKKRNLDSAVGRVTMLWTGRPTATAGFMAGSGNRFPLNQNTHTYSLVPAQSPIQ